MVKSETKKAQKKRLEELMLRHHVHLKRSVQRHTSNPDHCQKRKATLIPGMRYGNIDALCQVNGIVTVLLHTHNRQGSAPPLPFSAGVLMDVPSVISVNENNLQAV